MRDFFLEALKLGMISPLDSKTIKVIIDLQKKICCKINSNGKIGTGFFVK